MIQINKKQNFLWLLSLIMIITVSCERDFSDDVVDATYPNTADIFTDVPVGLTDAFFDSFDPNAGANPTGFGTDDNEAYEGTTSIRIDVPAPNDPDGNFIGGIFKDRGNGRNLTQYDALTFWAKGTANGTVEVGFGTDFEQSRFATSTTVQMTTGWKKYIVPIPDASKLVQEKGMFLFSAGGFDVQGDGPNGNEVAWTFWIDELRFETLGNNFVVSTNILGGQDLNVEGFTGSTYSFNPINQIVNLGNGQNVTTNFSPNYLNFNSTNPNVASVNESGIITVVGDSGSTTVTATIGNGDVSGSYTITSNGSFPAAPLPTINAANVISLFSDAYNNVPVRHYNGFFNYATTQGGAGSDPNNVDIQANVGGSVDNIINYTQLNFVSIGTYETVPLVDISTATHVHMDINVRENVDSADFIRILLESGTGLLPTTSGSFILNSTMLTSNTAVTSLNSDGWISVDIPLTSFGGFTDLANLGQLFFISDATISDIWVDNVYFYN